MHFCLHKNRDKPKFMVILIIELQNEQTEFNRDHTRHVDFGNDANSSVASELEDPIHIRCAVPLLWAVGTLVSKLWLTNKFKGEWMRVRDMPVEDVELVVRHSLQGSHNWFDRVEVSRRVQHNSSVRKVGRVLDEHRMRNWALGLCDTAPESNDLWERFQPMQRPPHSLRREQGCRQSWFHCLTPLHHNGVRLVHPMLELRCGICNGDAKTLQLVCTLRPPIFRGALDRNPSLSIEEFLVSLRRTLKNALVRHIDGEIVREYNGRPIPPFHYFWLRP